MRILTWLGLGTLGLVGFAGAAAWGVVHYVQSNDMREWAAWGAAKGGVPVTFGGPVEVKLWPQLLVKARDVQVASLQGSGQLASVEALALQADWGSGLKPWQGLQVRALEAKNPTITLTRTAAGVANWEAPVTTQTAPAASADAAANPLATLTEKGGMLAALRLAIANLNLTYADAQSGQNVKVEAMTIGARTEGTVATTTLNGKINGQPLKGELVADVADLAAIPLKAKLEGAGAALALDGRITEQKGFAGLINARSGNLQSTLKTLLGKAPAQAPASPAGITGDVMLGTEAIVLRNFAASLGELLKARGDIEIRLGNKPSGKGQLALQGDNLRALAELGSGQKQPSLPARPFNLSMKLAGEDTIDIQNLVLNLEPVLQLKGAVSITPHTGAQPDVTADLVATSPNLKDLLAAFGQARPAPNKGLQATLNLNGKGGVYTLTDVQAAIAELATASAKGSIDTRKTAPVVDVETTLQGTNMATTGAAFGMGGGLPTSGYSVRAKVRGSGPYELEGLTVNLPGLLELLGNLTYTAGTPASLQGNLTIGTLNATKLGYCGGSSSGASSAEGNSSTAAASTSAPWTSDALDLSALRQIALNLKVKANGITCSSVPLESASLSLRNTPSQLDIVDLVLGLSSGGKITGAATLAHAGTPKLNTALTLTDIVTERLVPALAAKGVKLPINGSVQLASQGNSTRALASNLGGNVKLNATEGQLPYTNMLGNVVGIERLLQGQAALPQNGSGSVDNMEAALVFRQGIGTFETLKVATGNGALNLTGVGTIDLPGWAIDLTLTPKLSTSSDLAVPVLVRGPLTAPAIGADPAFMQKLTKRLATEGLKSALGLDKEDAKGLGGVVGDVLGGKGLTQEGVGSLLNQFVKPKTQPTPTATPTPATEPKPEPAAPAVTEPASPAAEPPAAQEPAKPQTPEEMLQDALPGLLNGVLGQ